MVHNLVMNWVLALFVKIVNKHVVWSSWRNWNGYRVFYIKKTGPLDAGVEKTLDALEDIVTDLAQGHTVPRQ